VPTDSGVIAARALGRETITPSEDASFRRAPRQLAGSGSVIDRGRGYRDGRRRWALLGAAAAHFGTGTGFQSSLRYSFANSVISMARSTGTPRKTCVVRLVGQ
jgi:hypothetical protein